MNKGDLEDWVKKLLMGRRSEALILTLLLLTLASILVAVLNEERRGFLIGNPSGT